MSATTEQVRQALLEAHPYKEEQLQGTAELAMEATDHDAAKARKLLKEVSKGNGLGHFGLGDRAKRVIARLDAVTAGKGEQPEGDDGEEAIPPTESEEDEDPGPDDADAVGIDPFGEE
jgi:hypothetical protein